LRGATAAFQIGQDGLSAWDRAGHTQYRRISACAQWRERLLASFWCRQKAVRHRFSWLPTRFADAAAFRELAVRARRCAQEHL